VSLTIATAPTTEPLSVAEAKRQLRLGTTAGEPAPIAPTLALAGTGSGNITNGAHRALITFVTADGETEAGLASSSITVSDNSTNGKLTVTMPLGGAGVTARKVYLTAAGGSAYLLASTVSNNTATSETLNVADGSLGAQAPTTNTTVDPELTRLITATRERAELATQRALITQTWDLVLDEFPCDGFIEIPKPPLVSITHVKYRDTAGTLQTWPSTNYIVEAPAGPRARRGRVALAFGVTWPAAYGQAGDVQVRFVCGYGAASAVPQLIRSAMLADLATLYKQREQVITGTIVAELPIGSTSIYRSYKSRSVQRRAA
jgi:uncharacterized phiE125 gp8 family phage protein